MIWVRLNGSIRRFGPDLLNSIVEFIGSFLKGWFSFSSMSARPFPTL
jgi:hypothetical protein